MSRITTTVSMINSVTRSLVTADAYERSDFNPMGIQTMFKRVKAKTYKSERESKDNFDFIYSKPPTHNTAPVRRFHHAHRVDHSHFYAELLGPRSAITCEKPSTRGKETVIEDPQSRRTFGPFHPWRPPWTMLIKPNGINGHSRSFSGTPTPLLSPAKTTICIPSCTLSKKKSRGVPFPDSPAIIRTEDGVGLFKIAGEELDAGEPNIESRWSEFVLEDPDEFVDLDSEETTLTGYRRKLYATVHPSYTKLADASHRNSTNRERPQKSSQR